MPLQKTALAVQFQGGVETKQDSKQVPATKLTDLENATFIRQTTLAKRNGYRALGRSIDPGGSSYGDTRGIAARGDELLVFTDFNAYSYRESSNTWSDAGECASVVQSDEDVARTGTAQWAPDCATRNGIRVAAWEDSEGGVWYSVLEDATGRIIQAPAQLFVTGAISPRCIECGENVVVFAAVPSSGRIMSAVFNPAVPSALPATQIFTDDLLKTNAVYDAAPCLGSTSFATDRPGLIVWPIVGGWRMAYVHPSGVIGSPVNGLPSAVTFSTANDVVTGPISVTPSLDVQRHAVLWQRASGGGVKMRVKFVLSASLGTAREGDVGGGFGSGRYIRCTAEYGRTSTVQTVPELVWMAEHEGATTDQNLIESGRTNDQDSATDAESAYLLGHCLASRAFHDGRGVTSDDVTQDGHVYAAVVHGVRFFPYVAVVRFSQGVETDVGGWTTSANAVVVARSLPGLSAGALMRGTADPTVFDVVRHLPSVEARNLASTEVYSRIHRFPTPYRIQLSSENGDQFAEQGVKLVTLDFDNASSYQSAQLGKGMYLAGALPLHYDGSVFAEAGFSSAPDWGQTPTGVQFVRDQTNTGLVNLSNTGTGAVGPGTYLYKFWYEAVDAQGELHVGAVSAPVSVTIAGPNNTVTLTIPTCRLSKRSNIRVCVARSQQGATGTDDSIEFFRVTSTDPNDKTGDNAYLLNDPADDSVVFVDVLADASIATREPLYTNGGILSNDPAPWAGNAILAGKNRLFWTDPSNQNVVRFSQGRRDDTAVEQSIALSMVCDPIGGDIVGLGLQDEAVVVLKETGVQVFAGPGPLADPTAGTPADAFSPPQIVPSDIGCKDPGAVVTMPLGLMFPSTKGIVLLTRDRSIVLIGSPVYAYNDQTFVAGVLLPNRNQVLFLTSSGRSLLYDYEREQWSTFTNHEGQGGVIVNGTFNYLRTDGRVFRETPGIYVDDNSHIPMVITTAWIKFAEYLQGWQRIHHASFIGRWVSSHTLRVQYALDFQDAISAPIDIDVDADTDTTDTGAIYGADDYSIGTYGGSFPEPATVYQQQIHLNRRCEAIQFIVQDVEATGTFGAAFELSELLLTGGMLRPAFKLPASRSQ